MNRLENWFCASRLWQGFSARRLMPFLVEGVQLGDHVLEIGAGAGVATTVLQRLAPRVTALERDAYFFKTLGTRFRNSNVRVVQGDAISLPFPDATFSSVAAILVLHHIPSRSLQDSVLAEVHRVLRPGGAFLALEIHDDFFMRLIHVADTFVAVDRKTVAGRLAAFGFRDVSVRKRSFAFRVVARRASFGVREFAPAI